MKTQKRKSRKKKRVKRKIRRVFVSAVAMVLATATVVFCLNYIKNDTDFFNIKGLEVVGNSVYTDEFLIDKLGINIGDSLFNVDREKIKEKLKDEIYVKNCKVSYSLPNKLRITIDERKEKYLVLYNDQTIVLDEEGIVLDGVNQDNNLFTIECLTNVIYNIGEMIKIDGIDDFQLINKFVDYVNSTTVGDEIQKISIADNKCAIIQTKYGTRIKTSLSDDIDYNYKFAIEIIKTRMNENKEVKSGIIDFTKGENPVYSDESRVEEN